MTNRFRLSMAQLNPTVGDIAGNADKARDAWAQGKAAGADMVMLPEMFLVGYQTQDLIQKPAFVRDAIAAVEQLAVDCADGPMLGIGGPLREGDKLHNAYFVLKGGKVVRVYDWHVSGVVEGKSFHATLAELHEGVARAESARSAKS